MEMIQSDCFRKKSPNSIFFANFSHIKPFLSTNHFSLLKRFLLSTPLTLTYIQNFITIRMGKSASISELMNIYEQVQANRIIRFIIKFATFRS